MFYNPSLFSVFASFDQCCLPLLVAFRAFRLICVICMLDSGHSDPRMVAFSLLARAHDGTLIRQMGTYAHRT